MNLRASQIYVQSKTRHRLHLLCNVMSAQRLTEVTADAPKVSVDELADTIINQTIERLYPDIPEMEKRIAAIEREYADKLKQGEAKAA